ncbi:MAG: 6-carboxytetrahydropterin synthase QueD [Desulfomonilaceae bacterium]|nr:6-carboxytetrahydropterin synthase QueD [Desulfomonilaceae bacterium]
MYEVEIMTGFSAAHLLRNYNGKCERLHGHNYKVTVTARASSPGESGLVIDFGDLKRAANAAADKLDHRFLNEVPPFDAIEPSAENLAHYLFEEIAHELGDHAGMLHRVSVWESDNSRATYLRDVP